MTKFLSKKKRFEKEMIVFKDAISERHEVVKNIRKLMRKYAISASELIGTIIRKPSKINGMMKYAEKDIPLKKIVYQPKLSQSFFMEAFWTKLLARGRCAPLDGLQPNTTNTISIGAGKTNFYIVIKIMQNQIAFLFLMRKSHIYNWNLDVLRNQFIRAKIIDIQFENFTENSWYCSIVSPKFNFRTEAGCTMAFEYIEKEFPKFAKKIKKFTSEIKRLPIKKNSFCAPVHTLPADSQMPVLPYSVETLPNPVRLQ